MAWWWGGEVGGFGGDGGGGKRVGGGEEAWFGKDCPEGRFEGGVWRGSGRGDCGGEGGGLIVWSLWVGLRLMLRLMEIGAMRFDRGRALVSWQGR